MNEHVDQVEEVVECRIYQSISRSNILERLNLNIKIKKHNFRMLLWSCHTEVDWTA